MLPRFTSLDRSMRPSSLIGILETGTDSPVSMDSFTIASPERRTASQGKTPSEVSAASKMSPGTSEDESTICPGTKEHRGQPYKAGRDRRMMLTFSADESLDVAGETRHLSHPLDGLRDEKTGQRKLETVGETMRITLLVSKSVWRMLETLMRVMAKA